MKYSPLRKRTTFSILFIYFLLIGQLAFSQTNSNVKKEGNVGIEPFIVNLGKTIEHPVSVKCEKGLTTLTVETCFKCFYLSSI